MEKKKLCKGILPALLAALILILPASAADAAGWQRPTQARTSSVMLLPQDSGVHVRYMDGSGGWFRPEQPVTRAELAQMLSAIVADVPGDLPFFYDVPQDAWYAPAVQKAAGLGLMTGADGVFRPTAPATRAECAAALSMVIPYDVVITRSFPDVLPDHWAWYDISRTASYGLFRGDDSGNFHPDDSIRRCEVVAVFNRLLNRTPDTTYLTHHSDLRTFPDVPASHWAYGDIMEATVSHQYTSWLGPELWTWAESGVSVAAPPQLEQPSQPEQPTQPEQPAQPEQPSTPAQPSNPGLADGPQRIDGRLYWVINGEFVRDQSISGLYFDAEGRYSTKNADLDTKLNDIVEKITNDSMTRDQKLRALFNYVVNNYKYLARPMVSKGSSNWEPDYALFFLNNGKGNCFSFAAAYCLLCRELGLPAYTVVGASGKPTAPHGWVEIVLDGTTYMFDPELQWYYNNKTTKKYDLFMMQPSKVPSGVYTYYW